jgi:hypothetical protein
LEFAIKTVNAAWRFDRAIPMKFRIYRNSEADFYHHRDLENLDLHYSNAWFEKLLEHGFNGFWLNVWMRRLVAFRETETVEQTQRVDSLNRLIDRAGRFGVGVWLLLNEPKAYPRRHPIWERFPSMRGAPGTWGHTRDGYGGQHAVSLSYLSEAGLFKKRS